MTAQNMTVNQTAAVGQDIVSQYVQAYLWSQSKLLPTVLDFSSEAGKGVKSINVGRRAGATAVTKVAGTALESQSMVWTSDSLALDIPKACYTIIENVADLQSVIAQEPAILEDFSRAIMEAIEASVYTALATVSASSPDHKIAFDTSGTIVLADILEAVGLLDDQNCPESDRFLAVNPKQHRQLLALSDFIDASKYGSNMPVLNGEIGSIFGLRVIKSSKVTADTALVYHRSHVAFALQGGMQLVRVQSAAHCGFEISMLAQYGVKALDAGKRGILLNNSGS
jgi:N4-gp56 family major capsid protein